MSEASVAASRAIGAATDARILEVLRGHPRGLMMVDIAEATGFLVNRVCSAVRRIGPGVVRGKVLEGGHGMAVVVTLPCNAAAMHERIAEDIARRRLASKEKKAAANERASERRKNRIANAQGYDVESEWAPRRCIVPAHKAAPLGKLGPRWVFELAA